MILRFWTVPPAPTSQVLEFRHRLSDALLGVQPMALWMPGNHSANLSSSPSLPSCLFCKLPYHGTLSLYPSPSPVFSSPDLLTGCSLWRLTFHSQTRQLWWLKGGPGATYLPCVHRLGVAQDISTCGVLLAGVPAATGHKDEPVDELSGEFGVENEATVETLMRHGNSIHGSLGLWTSHGITIYPPYQA